MAKEKPGFLTPKAISNRIKAKGLQKLRWYCQMCQKQCRDENGFKCHTMSESHQRQLLLVAERPYKFVDQFSKEFHAGYLDYLKRVFGGRRVEANAVYQEYIKDRHHIHMNSTRWTTLTGYVQWLGREGICVVDQTEKGWFVKPIDRNPESILRQEQLRKKEKMKLTDEEMNAKMIKQQIERDRARQTAKLQAEAKVPKEFVRGNESEKVSFSLPKKQSNDAKVEKSKSSLLVLSESAKTNVTKPIAASSSTALERKKRSALDEIMENEEENREKRNRKDFWLHENIVVKVITRKLGEHYYKEKAVVKSVIDRYKAKLEFIHLDEVRVFDQKDLETVIPALGRTVLIVNGAYRGEFAELLEINEETFSARVVINSGPLKGRELPSVSYEDICKFAEYIRF